MFIAGLLEVVWAVGLKYTHGFSHFGSQRYHHRGDGGQHGAALMGDENPTGRYRLRRLDRDRRRGAAVTGIVLLGESASAMRIASLVCIVIGIIGLKISAH